MNEILNFLSSQTFKSDLENLSFTANILLAVTALFGLRQIWLFKKDMRLRNERAAKERAIEYATRYLTRYVELSRIPFSEMQKQKMKSYDGAIGDFTRSSLPTPMTDEIKKRLTLPGQLDVNNELLVIAAAFVTGVADEQTGFEIIGRTFCGAVESGYDTIAFFRNKKVHNYFEHIVILYRLWSPRLTRDELEEERRKISEKIASQPNSSISAIGCD